MYRDTLSPPREVHMVAWESALGGRVDDIPFLTWKGGFYAVEIRQPNLGSSCSLSRQPFRTSRPRHAPRNNPRPQRGRSGWSTRLRC